MGVPPAADPSPRERLDLGLIDEYFGGEERAALRASVGSWGELRKRRAFDELRTRVIEDSICLRAAAGLAREAGLHAGARRLVRAADMALACLGHATRLSSFQWGRAARAVVDALERALAPPSDH